MGALDHAPGEDEHVIITGCIARNLLDRPTYTGLYDERVHTNEQKFELTKPYARIMSTRIKGKPIVTEHMEDNGPVGEIIHSWIDEDTGSWHIQAKIDNSTQQGMDIVLGMLAGGENIQDNPFGEVLGELSLSSEGFHVHETSVVKRGARPGSTIDKVELVDTARLEAIKNQEYKPELPPTTVYIPDGAPIIRATFNHGDMSNFIALQNPTPAATYAPAAGMPGEAAPFANHVQDMRQKQENIHLQNQQQQQQAQQHHKSAEEVQKELTALRAQVAAMQRQQGIYAPTPQAQTPADKQFQGVINNLHNPNGATSTGNSHHMHGNPEDDKLMSIAGIFSQKTNVLSNEAKAAGASNILELAASTKAMRETLATEKAEKEQLLKQIKELEGRVQHHEGDKEKQKRQVAALLKKIVVSTNPPLSAGEKTDLDTAEQNMVTGQTDTAMMQLNPFLVRASAMLDAQTHAYEAQATQANAEHQQINLMQQMQSLIHPGHLVQASAGNAQRHGQKRGFEQTQPTYGASAAAAGSSSSSSHGSMWENSHASPYEAQTMQMGSKVHDMMRQFDGNTDDTIRMEDFKPRSMQRR